MNIENFREYCLSFPFVEETFPFDKVTLVFKVKGKIFALTNIEGSFRINVKCDPEKAVELREHYPAVIPGYHMSKKHWNTVAIDGSISDEILKEWIKDSYDLIFQSLPKSVREGKA